MRANLFPLSSRWVLGLTAGLAVICFLLSFLLIPTWANPDLRVILPYLREQIIFPTLFMAVAAAVFFNSQTSNSAVFGPVTALTPWQRCKPALFTLWISVLAGPLLGWSFVLGRGALAGFRLIDLIPLLGILIELLASASLAVLFANILPRLWKIVLTPLLCALVVFFPVLINEAVIRGTNFSSLSLAFMRGFKFVSYNSDYVIYTELIQIIYFALITVCAVAGACKLNIFALTRNKNALVSAGSYLLKPLIIFLVSIGVSPLLMQPYQGSQTCNQVGEHPICIPTAQAHLLPTLKHNLEVYLEQLPTGWVPTKEKIGFTAGTPTFFTLPDINEFANQREWEETIFSTLVARTFNFVHTNTEACQTNGHFIQDVKNSVLLRAKVPLASLDYLDEETGQMGTHSVQASDNPQLAFLTKLTVPEYHNWLVSHREAIKTCSLSKDMFK